MQKLLLWQPFMAAVNLLPGSFVVASGWTLPACHAATMSAAITCTAMLLRLS